MVVLNFRVYNLSSDKKKRPHPRTYEIIERYSTRKKKLTGTMVFLEAASVSEASTLELCEELRELIRKVGNIVPHTFVPYSFFLSARIVKENMWYNFPYGGKIRTKVLIFGSFFSDLHIVP